MEIAKRHPYLIGGGVIIAIGVYLLFSSSGGSAAGSGGDLASIYAAQASAQNADKQINAQLAGQQIVTGAQIAGLTIQGQTAKDLATINQSIELAKIGATQETTDLANTLTANVAIRNIQSNVDLASVNANLQSSIYGDLASVLITQAQTNAATAQAAINAASNQCHGFSCLF